jgi:hypothetical protein
VESREILAGSLYIGPKMLQYDAKWTGHHDDLKWYEASNFKKSTHQLCNFHNQYPNKPRPQFSKELEILNKMLKRKIRT